MTPVPLTLPIPMTALMMAQQFLGLKEIPGDLNNPQVMAMLQLDMAWPQDDETPWCSAFGNYVCHFLPGLERSGTSADSYIRNQALRARSWLRVGVPVLLSHARAGFDFVVLKRGGGDQPGPDVIEAPGHFGFYHSHTVDRIYLLGGNQGNQVSVAPFPQERVLAVRRLRRDVT